MYIVLELFPEPCIVTDEVGKVKFFETIDEAQQETKQCQNGKIVNIKTN